MSEIYYAPYEDWETWNDKDINDVIQDRASVTDIEVGQQVTVYSGELNNFKASDAVPDMAEAMNLYAYDNCGEVAGDWLCNKRSEAKLQKAVEDFIEQWCIDNGEVPTFGNIENIKPIDVLITKINYYCVEWELIEPESTKND